MTPGESASPLDGRCAEVSRAKRPSGPPSARLPAGFTVRLDRRVRRLDDGSGAGAALLGGSPGRLLHLAPAARRRLDEHDTLVVRDATGAALARRLVDAGVAHPIPCRLPTAPDPGAVTVVVPVRDRPAGLRRLLAALAATAPALAAVVVVDDGSADAAGHRAVAEAAGARLLRHPRPRGPAAARNTGLAAAVTEVVAFLDSDVVPTPGWLDPLLAHLADPAVGLAAPRVVGLRGDGLRGDGRGWLARYEQLRSSLDLGPDPAPVVPRSRVAYVPSAALVVRRAAVLAVGAGFDERMRVAEDVDLCLRLHAAGWRLRYEPAARVAHEHRVGVLGWWGRKACYGTGAAALAARHPGSVPPAVLAPWAVASTVLAASGRPRALLAAVLITAGTAVRLRRTLYRLRHPGLAALCLTGRGLGGVAGQLAGLLVRHWWPVSALACLVSRRARRAVLAAALAEGVHDWWAHRPEPGQHGLDPVRYLLAHRLDDLGYGAGLWWGAWRAPAALLPALSRRPRAPG